MTTMRHCSYRLVVVFTDSILYCTNPSCACPAALVHAHQLSVMVVSNLVL